jgi:transcriptional regulator GlxA family with amidase domain
MAATPPRIAIPVYASVDMLDVCGPYEMFRWAGFRIDLVAEEPGAVPFNVNSPVNEPVTFNVPNGLGDAAPCDALWVPGGSPDALKRIMADSNGPYLSFLRAQAKQSRYVCSVCEGALLLAAAGLLDGLTVTTHWAFIPYLMQTFPKVTVADGHPRFQLDGNVLTGGGISSGLDEALQLISLLAGEGTAKSAQQTTQYYPDPPVSSQIPNVISSPMMV